MQKEELKEKIYKTLCCTPMNELKTEVEKLSTDMAHDYAEAVLRYEKHLAEIALAIIKQANDTIWVTGTETVVERVLGLLCIETEDPQKALEGFLDFEPTREEKKD